MPEFSGSAADAAKLVQDDPRLRGMRTDAREQMEYRGTASTPYRKGERNAAEEAWKECPNCGHQFK